MKKTLLMVAVLLAMATSVRAEDLAIGEAIEGTSESDDHAIYSFEAEDAGALTLVARSTDGNDVVIVVTDDSGQQLSDGRIDIDYRGNTGAEQGVIVLQRPGEYQVHIMPYGDEVEYTLYASWLPWEELEVPADKDGKASGAINLESGEWIDGEIGYDAGDDVDWYRFEADSDGELIVETRGDEGDVVLDVFEEGEYFETLDSSDQDIDEEYTHEELTSNVDEGDVFYFRVRSYGSATTYEIRATMEGDDNGGDDDDEDTRPRSSK